MTIHFLSYFNKIQFFDFNQKKSSICFELRKTGKSLHQQDTSWYHFNANLILKSIKYYGVNHWQTIAIVMQYNLCFIQFFLRWISTSNMFQKISDQKIFASDKLIFTMAFVGQSNQGTHVFSNWWIMGKVSLTLWAPFFPLASYMTSEHWIP